MGLSLYVDPGKWHAALALFQENKRLLDVTKIQVAKSANPADAPNRIAEAALVWLRGRSLFRIGCEFPRIWSKNPRGDPNDTLYLTATNGALLTLLPAVERKYISTSWKGQVGKPSSKKDLYIMEARVRKRLHPRELEIFGANPSWDETDAVGIGLCDQDRM